MKRITKSDSNKNPGDASQPSAAKPNIILINCDDLGYGDIGCYGSLVNKTPHLDRMALDGVRFTDFYMPAPVCSPSRAGLMTGCYPARVGLQAGEKHDVLFPGDAIGLSSREITIADILKQQGYATRIIGKWHLGDQKPFLPMNHGFDGYFGLPYSNDMLPEHPAGRKFGFPPLPLIRDNKVVEADPNQAALSDLYLRDALEFIDANRSKPFFLYFAHMYVHMPIHVPMRLNALSDNGAYGAAVEHVDAITGAILKALKEWGLDDNTLVVFTSDNGAVERIGSNAPLRGGKGSPMEGGMRLPCIMRWPERIPRGTVCREMATAMDFLPTLAAFAGGSAPSDRKIDGKDISDLALHPEEAQSPHEAFFYYREHKLKSVRSGRWKYSLEQNILFDLHANIFETIDLAEEHPEILKRMRDLGQACREDIGDELTETNGANCREPGRVSNPTTLLPFPRNDPIAEIIQAGYD